MSDTINMSDDYLTQLADSQGIGVPEKYIEEFFMFARAAARAQQRFDFAATPPLANCSETIRDAILKGNPLAIGLACGLASLVKGHLPVEGKKSDDIYTVAVELWKAANESGFGVFHSLVRKAMTVDSEPANETPGSSLMRALNLEIQNCEVDDKDKITWLVIRCRNTVTHLYPRAVAAHLTEQQIRQKWYEFASRNDLDAMNLRTVTAFILELTR